MNFDLSINTARALDQGDELSRFRQEFLFPEFTQTGAYLCGNSLGLQPKETSRILMEELAQWSALAVEGHFSGPKPWADYHEQFAAPLARIIGAKPAEVVAMNSLTANLHLLLVSFFQPNGKRTKIITEKGAFSSDRYALCSQLRWHGLDPAAHLIEVAPRPGEETLRKEDLLQKIEENGDTLALVFLGAVNYYTGQLFPLAEITEAAHAQGALCGFDLAHAIGNVPLQLHQWKADFAVWCSYKYLNAGPGAVGGAFVHEQHLGKTDLQRLEGWWGHRKEDRFEMHEQFNPYTTAEAWQLSNAPVFNMAGLSASLKIFDAAGIAKLRTKSEAMCAYLDFLLAHLCKGSKYTISSITPKAIAERGAQISLRVEEDAEALFEELRAAGFITDRRRPAVIRIAPAPLYNTFEEIYHLSTFLGERCRWKSN